MTNKNTFQLKLGEKTLQLQPGALAEQASGSCLVRFGDTSILCTAQLGEEKPEMGFFPLTCNYEERYYAAGKILGSRFVRREGRPTTEATLTARMIDRIVRPLFSEGLRSEIQVIATCLSWDAENDPDLLGILGASTALALSEIPWSGPVGAVRVGKIGKNLILNPTYIRREESEIDVVLSGHEEMSKKGGGGQSEILINMIDGRSNEMTEETMTEIFEFARPFIKELIDFQKEIANKVGKKKIPFQLPVLERGFESDVKKVLVKKLEKALYLTPTPNGGKAPKVPKIGEASPHYGVGVKKKQDRQAALADLKEEIIQLVSKDYGEERIGDALCIFERATEKILKENVLKKEKRPDARKLDEVREINVEVGFLPRTHGTGLFSRGETKVLSILTLGSPGDHLLMEGMEIVGKKRFMHHYNFPPYSVGEVRRLIAPGRREIGHGMLAEKALLPLLPNFDDFPYTIRIVSEVVSSNGSSSMAAVSAASLALMDAGVPILRPAAGIAIGLIRESNEVYKILTDIQGPEDSHGEMDLKVAGTEKGITAIQMDVKGEGITTDIFRDALEKAKKARLEILSVQNKVLAKPRKELSPFAPRVYTLQINPEKIGLVIGTGGRTINEITENCGVSIDIEESGKIFVAAEGDKAAQKAIDWIRNLTKELKIGEIFQGKVKKILDFGAVVEIAPGKEGLVHISQFVPFRVNKVQDLVKVGDVIPVKIIGISEEGRTSLSAKEAGFRPKRLSD